MQKEPEQIPRIDFSLIQMIDFHKVQLINLSQNSRQEPYKDERADNSTMLQTAAGWTCINKHSKKERRHNRIIIINMSAPSFHRINWEASEI